MSCDDENAPRDPDLRQKAEAPGGPVPVPETTKVTPNRIECIACFKEIDSRAALCPHCGSYQRNWKNHFRYYAGIISLVAFVLAVLGYFGDRIYDFYKWLTWVDQIKIVSFESIGSSVLLNAGDGRIIVSALIVTSNNPDYKDIISVNKSVERGHTIEFDTGSANNQDYRNWTFVADVSDAKWEENKKIEHSGFMPKYYDGQNSVARQFLADTTTNIRSFDCTIEVRYVSSRYRGEQREEFSGDGQCRGFLMKPPP